MNKYNHYVSVYQKDYTWPSSVTPIYHIQPTTKPAVIKSCACVESQMRKEKQNKNLEKCLTVSQIPPGFTRRFPEQNMYPKIERTSKTDFQEKSSDTHYKLIKKSLPNEILKLINAARMKTTYQADYCHPGVTTQRDLAMTVIDTNGQRLQHRVPIRINIEGDCLSRCQLLATICNESKSVRKRDRKRKNGSKCGKKDEDIEKRQVILPWRSEYQDSINKIGHAIIKAELHRGKKKASPVQYEMCTTFN
ncbi:hypothetical protein PUN28_013321 [Cardiocondyla obscurior]|uniref:Uncharacterized protein n=1 Tax=Cardiocondyla obscurior TaxID=286306 RepID=A0AAW2FBX7_9HYME